MIGLLWYLWAFILGFFALAGTIIILRTILEMVLEAINWVLELFV